MTEQKNTNRERLENIWLRLVFMLLFFIGHRVSSFILMVIAAIQFVLMLFKNNKNERLIEFSTSLNKYIYQSGTYLSFEQDTKPFPFDSWPNSETGVESSLTDNEELSASDAHVAADSKPEQQPVKEPKSKPAPKKETARKAPANKKSAAAKKDVSKPGEAKPKPTSGKAAPEGNES